MDSGRAWWLAALLCACGGREVAHTPAPATPTFVAPAAGACRCDPLDSASTCCGEAPLLPMPACGAKCGDGHADACPDLRRSDLAEDCDGSDLRGATCASVGYASGALSCDSSCHFDRSACDDCAPGTDCTHPFDEITDAAAIALAVNGDTLGVAWLTNTGMSTSLYFAELDGDLAPSTPVFSMPVAYALRVALAPGPVAGDWILAVESLRYATADQPQGSTTTLVALSGSGASARMAEPDDRASGLLVPRPGDMPLFIYSAVDDRGRAVLAQVPSLEGHEGTAPFVVDRGANPDFPAYAGAGALLGDGFLVATEPTGSDVVMRLVPVSARGEVGRAVELPLIQGGACSLSADGPSVRLVYQDLARDGVALDDAVFWRPLAPDGTLLGTSQRLTQPDEVTGDFRALVFGANTALVRAPDTGGEPALLSLSTFDGDGNVLRAASPLTQVPHIGGYDAVRLGDEIIVAWVGQPPTGDADARNLFGRITLARARP